MSNDQNLPLVLHVRTVNGFGGGPEKTILNSPRFLPPLGYQSKCVYLHPPNDSGIEILKKRAFDAQAEIITLVDHGPKDLKLIQSLIQLCRQQKVCIWHAHDDKTNVLGVLVRSRVPMRLVTTAHGWGANLGVNPWKSWFYRQCSRNALRFYHQSIAVSPDILDTLRRWGIPEKKRILIENAIDTDAFRRTCTTAAARQQFGRESEDLVIAALGRLAPEKGFMQLIRAVADARQQGAPVQLWIGGDGKLESDLQAEIERLKVQSHVHLLGHLTDPKLMLQAADMFVLSSLREGLPNVVLEAMALETPVISTRVAGVPRVITHEQDGLLVDVEDHSQMVSAILRLSQDAPLRQRLAQRGRQRIEENYDFAHRMRKVAAVYDRLSAGGP